MLSQRAIVALAATALVIGVINLVLWVVYDTKSPVTSTTASPETDPSPIPFYGNAETVTTINGRLAQGLNIELTGEGTALQPYRISAVPGLGSGTGSTISAASRMVPLVIIIGESNSGGRALNTDATDEELAPQPQVQILNNDTLVFEALDIGTNQNLGHAGPDVNLKHGWELQLANSVTDGEWWADTVFLIKTGQGGTTVADWDEEGAYWTTAVSRFTAAREFFHTEGLIPVPYLFVSIGINDSSEGVSVGTWKTGMTEWLGRLRAIWGFAPIVMTKLMLDYTTYNTAIDELTESIPFTYAVLGADASLQDAVHWDYAGMKLVGSRLIAIAVNTVGEYEKYLLSQSAALSGLTIAAPASIELSGAFTRVTWTGTKSNTAYSDPDLVNTSTTAPIGGAHAELLDFTGPFQFEFTLYSTAETSALVLMVDDDTTNFSWTVGITPYFAFWLNTTMRVAAGNTTGTNIGTPPSFPYHIRGTKLGDSLVYSGSTDGTTFTNFYTHADVFVGHTQGYFKAIFLNLVANQRIAVAYRTA